MRAVWSIGLAVLALTAALLFADLHALKRLVIEQDERPGAYSSPQRVLSRLQADLERVAAGHSPARLPQGVARDPLENLADAVDAFLRGRNNLFRDHLALVRAEALRRLARQDGVIRSQRLQTDLDKVTSPLAYGAGLAPPPRASALLTLAQTMRLVDAVLVLESAESAARQMRYDPATRRNLWIQTASDAVLDGVWLRLPCPMVLGRREAFEDAARRLGSLAGPLLSCPVGIERRQDFALQERLARDPKGFGGVPMPPPRPSVRYDEIPPPPPWTRDAAIRFMADNPDGAESPLRLATLDGLVARLDLALFLHAFREPSEARDGDIRSLMAGVDRAAQSNATAGMVRLAGSLRPYDGSDFSLLPSLRLASFTGVAAVASGTYRYPYVIPCAVIQRRPGLAAAESFEDLSAEASGPPTLRPPISGCLAGRGRVEGFPEAEFAAFLIATAAADGGGNAGHGKMPRYPVGGADLKRMERIMFDPRALLAEPAPVQAYPYQTWGYASLTTRAATLELRRLFEASRASLARYFHAKGLDETESDAAAQRALFASAYGSNCGDGRPPRSLRKLVMDEAAPEEIAALLKEPSSMDPRPFADCAFFAPFDPLLHVTVGHPAALPLLWQAAEHAPAEVDPEGLRAVRQVNARNHFGKTALMAAAQADRIDSVRFLLNHGAWINADTWQVAKVRTLAHDSRTALMYAAGNGSAPLIKALLEAGADRFQADSKGRRAIDYLLGTGPGPANARLTPAERGDVARLLY
ncbi:MAG: ankyrin repeat domain-containing protein [Phaeospirillum sp.]|nr:ankyrin repeat domain-containing protein [Phaeospirillum sp.]